MEDSKIIKKFQRLLEERDQEHIFSGTIMEFDMVEYAPKDRYTKGILVTSLAGTSRVTFSARAINKPIVNANSLQINDSVHILGTEYNQRPNTTVPSIIVVPDRRMILFAKERDIFSWRGDLADYLQALSYLFGVALLAIYQFAIFLPLGTPLGASQSYVISLQIGLMGIIFILVMVGVDWYRSHITRFRLVRCNPDTWNTISSMMS